MTPLILSRSPNCVIADESSHGQQTLITIIVGFHGDMAFERVAKPTAQSPNICIVEFDHFLNFLHRNSHVCLLLPRPVLSPMQSASPFISVKPVFRPVTTAGSSIV